MREEELHALFERYRTGQCTTEEKKLIDQWFDQSIQEPLSLSRKKKKLLEREIFRHIQPTVKEKENERRWMGIAASFLLFVALGYLLSIPTADKRKKEQTPLFSYQTHAGQRVKLVLPDSSLIWLNSNTAIRYDQAFSGNKREIFLDSGEAFFDIKKQADKPFIVYTGQLENRVLGTSFNIRVKDYRNRYHLSVNTGKVQVRERANPGNVLGNLEAAQRFSYDYGTKQVNIHPVAPEEMSAWKENVLLLHSASWEQVKDKLETWYGINLIVNLGHSKVDKFTARLENPSLKEALDALSKINRFTYQIKGKEVVVHR